MVALGRGGALETVIDGVTGVLVDEPTPAALAAGIARASQLRFDRAVIRAHAITFDRAVFSRAMQSTIESLACPEPRRGACLEPRRGACPEPSRGAHA